MGLKDVVDLNMNTPELLLVQLNVVCFYRKKVNWLVGKKTLLIPPTSAHDFHMLIYFS